MPHQDYEDTSLKSLDPNYFRDRAPMSITGIGKPKIRTIVRHWVKRLIQRFDVLVRYRLKYIKKNRHKTKQGEQIIRGSTKTFNRGRPEGSERTRKMTTSGRAPKLRRVR